jgi:hypothetical protein
MERKDKDTAIEYNERTTCVFRPKTIVLLGVTIAPRLALPF